MQYPNIVFDMGNVLIDYDPDKVTKHYTDDPVLIKKIHNLVFSSMEWIKLDAGLISEKVALSAMLKRFDSDAERELAKLAFLHWDHFNMWAKPGMESIVRDLKNRGHRIYILSNASLRLPKIYMNYMPAAELYDGVFFSAEYQLIKPQKEIYQTFLNTFHLDASECFFIDDLPENIAAAKSQGFGGYCFDGNVEKLKNVLALM
jgi:putative hydrolase of the HAD superfamily